VADWVAASPAATPVVGAADSMRCMESVKDDAECDFPKVPDNDFVTDELLRRVLDRVNSDVGSGTEFSVAIQRTGSDDAPCPRTIGTTAVGTGCAPFRVQVVYDCTNCSQETLFPPPDQPGDPVLPRARVEINEGVLVFVSTGSGSN
jgi:hypothetical protein